MIQWFKSSYSGGDNNCVEVAHTPVSPWRSASYSGTSSNCVEVAGGANGAAIRDTKHRELGALAFDSSEWEAFLSCAKDD